MNKAVEEFLVQDEKLDTRDKLILVAIRMFAEQGFAGVSMRTINSAAGTRNSSAVHYHFGNKMGIIQAIFDKLQSQLRPIFDEITLSLRERLAQDKLVVEDVVMAMQLPFWYLYNTPVYGKHAVKLIARLIQEADDDMKVLYNRYMHEPAAGLFELAHALMPAKPEHQLRFQMVHCFMATVSGLATIDLLDNTPLGDIRFQNDLEMMLCYMQYSAFGLSNQSATLNLDMEFWGRYAQYWMPGAVTYPAGMA